MLYSAYTFNKCVNVFLIKNNINDARTDVAKHNHCKMLKALSLKNASMDFYVKRVIQQK